MRKFLFVGLLGAAMSLSGCGMLVASVLDENERAGRSSAPAAAPAKSSLAGSTKAASPAPTAQTKEQLCARLEVEHKDERLVLFRRKLMNGCGI